MDPNSSGQLTELIVHIIPLGQDLYSHQFLLAQWLLSSGVRKVPGAVITAMDMPIWARWANDHDVAHLQAVTVQMNLIWSEYHLMTMPSSYFNH